MIRAAIVGAAALLGATTVAAQTNPVFPASREPAALRSWLSANTDITPNEVVSVRGADLIAIVAAEAAGPDLFKLKLRSELIDPAAAQSGRLLSWSADVEVDCTQSRARVSRITDYPERNLKGSPKPATTSGQWMTSKDGSNLQGVIAAVCSPPEMARVEPAKPAPKLATVLRPAVDAPRPVAASPSVPKPSPVAAAGRGPSSGYKGALQVAAGADQAAADKAAKDLQRRLPSETAGLTTQIVPAVVNGRTVYRATFTGFASKADANSVCSAIRGQGGDCFIR